MKSLTISCLLAPLVHAAGLEDAAILRTSGTGKLVESVGRGHANSNIGGASVLDKRSAEITSHALMRKDRTEKQKTKTGVTWTRCTNGVCQCEAGPGTDHVIRYRQSGHEKEPPGIGLYENWYYREHFVGEYTRTPETEFHNMGFANPIQSEPGADPITVTTLHTCGGRVADSKDCLYIPTNCSFDTDLNNPHDAKSGEFCCSTEFKYCSYKCMGSETFACPDSVDQNFLGGMDPVGSGIPKACYMAQYNAGSIPEYTLILALTCTD